MHALVDTHSHIYLAEFDDDRAELMARATQAGVVRVLMPNIDAGSIESLLACARQFPDLAMPMMGLHPCSVKADFQDQLNAMEPLWRCGGYCGIGEIGLDFYWDTSTESWQREAFEVQLNWAAEANLPVSVHVRSALPAALEIVERLHSPRLRGVFHCFSGTESDADRIAELGTFCLGIGGVVTFKNGGLDQALKPRHLQHLVLETDAPYLAPVPHRGKRNEPAFLPLIAARIAEIIGTSADEVARHCTANSAKLFGLTL